MIKRNDILLLCLLVGISLLLLAGRRMKLSGGADSASAQVRILQDGASLGEYSLWEEHILEIAAPDGGRNLVEIGDGACTMLEADCPDGICLKRGTIRLEGETIVCLPHRLVVEITGGTSAGVDSVAR